MNDRLPTKFKTWNQFHAELKDKILPDTSIISYYEFGPFDGMPDENRISLRYELNYIKAKCYDEFLEWFPKNIQPDPYANESACYWVEKIEHFLNISQKSRYV